MNIPYNKFSEKPNIFLPIINEVGGGENEVIENEENEVIENEVIENEEFEVVEDDFQENIFTVIENEI